MRKIDEIANEKFNGDMNRTLEYLLYEADGPFTPYVEELTQEEARMVMKFLERDAIKHYGSEENFYDEIDKNGLLRHLDLSEDEVRNATKNPYKAKMLKNALKMLIMEGGIIALGLVGGSFGLTPAVLGMAGSVATGIWSMTLAGNIIDYVRFRKAKKIITAQDQNATLVNESRGRGM